MNRPNIIRRQGDNVIPLPIAPRPSLFEQLTARLVLQRHREGTLPEGVVAALLAGVEVQS
jgi:hypothetical protein